MPIRYTLQEAEIQLRLSLSYIEHCIDQDWVKPASEKAPELDEEDLARLLLIAELRDRLGVNDEGIAIVLHLVDQLYYLKLKRAHM